MKKDKLDMTDYKNKLMLNAVIDLNKFQYSELETAKILKDLSNHFSCKEIQEMTGITRDKLYLKMAILKSNANTLKLYNEGKITGATINNTLFNLKDETKQDEVIKDVMDKELNSRESYYRVAEINNTELIVKHFKKDCDKFVEKLDSYKNKFNELDDKQKLQFKIELDKFIKHIKNEW